MLSYLRIRGLALLDDVTLELNPGMNVMTGETGAGKSIIVDALALLRGGRGRAELVRAGVEAAVVDAQFDLEGGVLSRLRGVLEKHGLPLEDPALVLQRTVPRTARGRSLVQGELTTQVVLGEVGQQLIDICSQHEHHSLTHVSRHLELLDSYAGLEPQLRAYAEVYREYREAIASLEGLKQRAADGLRRLDFLRFQIEELERVTPEPGEFEALKSRLVLLRDAQRWAEFAQEATDTLYESADAVAPRLAVLLERSRAGAAFSPKLARVAEQLEAAQIACQEAAQEVARFGGELELDPGELERAEERVHQLISLQKKHGVSVDELGPRLAAMREELSELENAEFHVERLEQRVAELSDLAQKLARKLHDERRQAAGKLAVAVMAELSALHLGRARLEAKQELLPPEELGPRGLDRVEFMFSANPGEPLAPLTRVASGGELSRVLLGLKSVLSTGDTVATYVFDEVDAGVGGAVAEAIGRRLRLASAGHQVLCITHLPQIAAFAHHHFRVEKREQEGRTLTRVVRLSEAERVEELARMLGGARVTESARKHASELIEEAQKLSPPGRPAPAPVPAPKKPAAQASARRATARQRG